MPDETTPPTEPDDATRDARRHGAFKKALSDAASYAQDPERLKALIGRAEKRAAGKASGPFEKIRGDLPTVFRMLRAYARGRYREIPYKILLGLIAAVAYFLMPADLIPDFLGPFGFFDDAAVLGWAINQARSQLQRFREWEDGEA